MAEHFVICTVNPDLVKEMKAFRMRKQQTIASRVMKIDKAKCEVILDEEFEDITVDELREELPDQQPRYIALSYVWKHDDGRVSFPLIFFYISPQGCHPELQMMYAGSKQSVVKAMGFTKVIELRSYEDFTEEYILDHLKRFG